jgi:hypothetical protein
MRNVRKRGGIIFVVPAKAEIQLLTSSECNLVEINSCVRGSDGRWSQDPECPDCPEQL